MLHAPRKVKDDHSIHSCTETVVENHVFPQRDMNCVSEKPVSDNNLQQYGTFMFPNLYYPNFTTKW